MHPQHDQLLRDLIYRAANSDLLPGDLSVIDAGWEFRGLLARIATESSETGWSPEIAGMISQARVELAVSGRIDALGGAALWVSSNGLTRAVLLGTAVGWPCRPYETAELVARWSAWQPQPGTSATPSPHCWAYWQARPSGRWPPGWWTAWSGSIRQPAISAPGVPGKSRPPPNCSPRCAGTRNFPPGLPPSPHWPRSPVHRYRSRTRRVGGQRDMSWAAMPGLGS